MATEPVSKSKSSPSRFSLWLALTTFSIVVLTEIADRTKDLDERSHVLQWALAVAALTFIFGFLALVATVFARDLFVATPLEAGLILLCLGFWSAGLPNILSPKNSIAIEARELDKVIVLQTRVANVNVYFFSWASFLVALLAARSFVLEVIHAKYPDRVPKHTVWLWYGVAVASLVVLATASRTLHLSNCDLVDHADDLSDVYDSFYDSFYGSLYGETLDQYKSWCRRIKFGVALGVVSTLFSAAFGTLVFLRLIPVVVEAGSAVLTLLLWVVGVGLLNFGNRGPNIRGGDFYFGSWAAFVLSLFLASDAVGEAYEKLREGNDNQKAPSKEPPATEKSAPATEEGQQPAPEGAAAAAADGV